MNNAEWMVKNGYKFSDLRWSFMQEPGICGFYLNGKNVGKESSLSIFEALKTWLDTEHAEQILDDVEKRYLKGVIRPFRDRIKYIGKTGDATAECIYMQVDSEIFYMPDFNTGTMYKGMELGHEYTLEELGL